MDEARCPKCGGQLHARIEEVYQGVPLKVDGYQWEYATWDGDMVSSVVVSVSCVTCEFATDHTDELFEETTGKPYANLR